jgi:hypothetical protein
MKDRLLILIVLCAAIWLAGPPPAEAAKEGFGWGPAKKAASVVRVSPPAVYLMGTKIQVKASSSGTVQPELAARLQSQLESELISRDRRLSAEANHPETSIEVSILQSDENERWEDRTESRSVQVGKDSKGKAIYESREFNVRYKMVTHEFSAAYKVMDRAKGLSLDADSLRFDFKNDFREGKDAPELFSLESSAIGKTVETISRRLTPTRETIGVLLPKGSFEDLVNLATVGQWNRYLEALERKTPNSNPVDESYRQYALGVAYEALGYGTEDPSETLRYLEQASLFYNKALESNPGEKFFSQAYDSLFTSKTAAAPLERVQTALINYRKIDDFQKRYNSLQAAQQKEAVEGGKSLNTESMNNAAVIRMVRAGLSTEVILTSIETAPKAEFDVSPNGLIALSDAQVDKKIIQRLQEIATGKKVAAPGKAQVKRKPVAKIPKPSSKDTTPI